MFSLERKDGYFAQEGSILRDNCSTQLDRNLWFPKVRNDYGCHCCHRRKMLVKMR